MCFVLNFRILIGHDHFKGHLYLIWSCFTCLGVHPERLSHLTNCATIANYNLSDNLFSRSDVLSCMQDDGLIDSSFGYLNKHDKISKSFYKAVKCIIGEISALFNAENTKAVCEPLDRFMHI